MKKIRLLLYILLFALILSFFLILHFGNKSMNLLKVYAKEEARKIVSTIINKIVLEEVTTKIDFNELYKIVKNNSGEIQTIDFDPLAVNYILSFVTNSVEENLYNMEEGNLEFMNSINLKYKPKIKDIKRGIVAVIPLGITFNNPFLGNLGPKIPVRLKYIGSVSTNLVTTVKDYGINNALIELSVHISVTELVNIPFNSEEVVVTNDIPIAIKIIQGKIPAYYGNMMTKTSPLLTSNIDN